jgi:hypothetical protein
VEILFGIVFTKIYGFIPGKKLAIFGYVLGVFLPLKFKLILRILNCSANESKTLSLSDQSLQGSLLELSPWRVKVGKEMWR